jgi:hypothetical protein
MAYADAQDVLDYLGIEETDLNISLDVIDDSLEAAKDWIDHITQTTYADVDVLDEVIDFTSDTTHPSAASFDSTSPLRLPAYPDLIALPHNNVIQLEDVFFNRAVPGETPEWEEQNIGTNVRLHKGCLQIIKPTFYPRDGIASIKASYIIGKTAIPAYVKRLSILMAARDIIQGAQSSTGTAEGGSIRVGDLQINEPSNFSLGLLKATQDEIDAKLAMLGTHNTYLI